MDDEQPHSDESGQGSPSKDELQERAQSVWKTLKFLFSGMFLLALLVIAVISVWLFHAFGFTGLILGAIGLGVGIFLLCKHLLTY